MTLFGRISEDLLLRAHGGPMRVEACACGSFIAAKSGEEPQAVAAHNTSELHQLWRSWMRLLDEMPVQTDMGMAS